MMAMDRPRGFYTYGEGDTCEACLVTDMLDRDPETGVITSSIVITTDSCPRCGEDIRRCEDCVIDANPHANGCQAPEVE
jgi:predicted RNA-binding Zn-ribbon protein involved in translation (DUF1610 family)